MNRPTLEVADIFRRYGHAYRAEAGRSLSTPQRRVMTAEGEEGEIDSGRIRRGCEIAAGPARRYIAWRKAWRGGWGETGA